MGKKIPVSRNRRRRIQARVRKGMTVKEIAAEEKVSEQTVRKALSSTLFRKSLAVRLATQADRRIRNSETADKIIEKQLEKILTDAASKDSKVKLTARDLSELGKLSAAQHEQGTQYLKKLVDRANEEADDELQKATDRANRLGSPGEEDSRTPAEAVPPSADSGMATLPDPSIDPDAPDAGDDEAAA